MVAIAVNLLAFLPPGILFPKMRENTLKRDAESKEAKRAKKAEKARRKCDHSQQDLEMSEASVEENKH